MARACTSGSKEERERESAVSVDSDSAADRRWSRHATER